MGGLVLAIAVVILYVRQRGAEDIRVEVMTEAERLQREIAAVWSRCGALKGYVDTMAKRIVDTDPAPDAYNSVVHAARGWQEWRREQAVLEKDAPHW